MKLLRYGQFITESQIPKHAYHIPTYEDCRLICDTHDNFIFYEFFTSFRYLSSTNNNFINCFF